MSTLQNLKKRWLKKPAFAQAYKALNGEFASWALKVRKQKHRRARPAK